MKFAVVTGTSRGIGREVAVELSKNDFEMVLVARNKEGLEETKRLINGGGKAIVLPTDLSDLEAVNGLVKKIQSLTKQVDLIANIAGVWHGNDEVYAGIDFENFDEKVLIETMNVGITASMLLVKGLIPLMPKSSHIVNLSGTFENGGKGWLPYYVSKRALEDFTVGLADELREKGITVNCVSPSDTATESYKKFFPQYINESIDPKEIAKLFIKILNTQETGKVWVIKKGKEIFKKFH